MTETRLTVVTFGVADLDRAIAFYGDGLGLRRQPHESTAIAFFDLGGVTLALFPRGELAADAGVAADGAGFRAITLAMNQPERAGVDALLARAEAAGGRVVKPGEDKPWGGYSGYFADLDGHLWEAAWPLLALD